MDDIKLETLKHHKVVARFDYFDKHENKVVVIFNEISDQTLLDGINIDINLLDTNYKSNDLLINLENIIKYLETKGFMFGINIDETLNIISEHLSKKAVIIDEYFILNESDKYIKTGDILNIVDQDVKKVIDILYVLF